MTTVFAILFFVSLLGIVHTYILYPGIMLAIRRKLQKKRPAEATLPDPLPEVEVIFAAYNEESVIEEKIHSLFRTDYPAEKLKVTVGSDHSTDSTDEKVRALQERYPSLRLERFPGRMGKSRIINSLAKASTADVLLPTDANIIFSPPTIPRLIAHFSDPAVTICGGHIRYTGKSEVGIAPQEKTYLDLENKIKSAESLCWDMVMGVEGGCYAIRKMRFPGIPPLFYMEDFYVTLAALEDGGKVHFEPEALCYEDISTQITEEFKRKTRISIGNFQNLKRFIHLPFEQPWPLGFAFASHKILRWITPLLLLALFVSNIYLLPLHPFFQFTFAVELITVIMAVAGRGHKAGGKFRNTARYFRHFYYMNLALLNGLWEYLKGVKSNVWQPTQRNQ